MGQNCILRIQNPPYGSPFQNRLIAVRFNIQEATKWLPGDGKQVFMWEYAWLKDEPLINLKDYKYGVKWTLKCQGSIIVYYFEEDTNSQKIHKPSRGRIENQLKKLEKELSEYDFKLNRIEGKPMWKVRKNGKYWVKEEFKALRNNPEKKGCQNLEQNLEGQNNTQDSFFLMACCQKMIHDN